MSSTTNDAIIQAIDVIASKRVKGADVDRTVQASIEKVIDSTIGSYDVVWKGSDKSYRAYAINTNEIYKPGQPVYVLIPGNNPNNTKTIFGPVKRLKNQSISSSSNTPKYVSTGYNVLKQNQNENNVELQSFNGNDSFVIYDSASEENFLSLKKSAINTIKNGNYLTLSFDVQTRFHPNYLSRGNFGIKMILQFKNGTDPVTYITKEYVFDITHMTGDPYNYRTATTQRHVFEINGAAFSSIKSITAFCENFTPPETTPSSIEITMAGYNYKDGADARPTETLKCDGKIVFSNISLEGTSKLSESELNGKTINLQFQNGNTFIDKEIETLPVLCQFLVNRDPVNPTQQEVGYYWFKRDSSIDEKSVNYVSFGGIGWKCINTNILKQVAKKDKEDEEEKVKAKQFLSDSNTKSFEIANNSLPSNLYKIVVDYNNEKFQKQFTLKNDSVDYYLSFSFKNLPNGYKKREETENYLNVAFEKDFGYPNLTAVIKNKKAGDLPTAVKWQWSATDQNGTYKAISTTGWQSTDYPAPATVATLDYLKCLQILNDLVKEKRISSATKITNENLAEVLEGSNLQLVKKNRKEFGVSSGTVKNLIDKIKEFITFSRAYQYQSGDTVYNIDISKIQGFNTFYVTCYNKDNEVVAQGSVVIGNDVNGHGGYHLVLHNATQSFIYDQNNSNPTPAQGQTLTYTLYSDTGAEVPHNQVTATWKIPVQNTMLYVDSSEWAVDNVANLFDDTYRYFNEDFIPFKVRNAYNPGLSNNTIQLTVNCDGYKISEKTNFTITQEGKSGTNGTGTVLILTPKANDGTIVLQPCYQKIDNNDSVTSNFKTIDVTTSTQGSTLSNIKWTLYNINNNSHTNPIKSTTSSIQIPEDKRPTTATSQILKVEAKVDGKYISAELPIFYLETTIPENWGTKGEPIILSLEPNTGYTEVIYQEDGTNPTYNNKIPFTLKMTQDGDDITKIIPKSETKKTRDFWYSLNTKWFPKVVKSTTENNVFSITPSNRYIDDSVFGKEIIFKNLKENATVKLHIPVHFMINRYSHANINGWDGNSVSIGNDYILSPQVGAGQKNDENKFTGVVMGTVRKGSTKEQGLFGYDEGVRSIFLDAKGGSATFGKAGGAQIKIDVKDEDSVIQSGDYPKNSKGDPAGMKIKLSSTGLDSEKGPYIKFGSKNFSVSSDGHLTAKGGGSIAGWEIGDNALTNSQVDKDGNGLSTGLMASASTTGYAIWAGRPIENGSSKPVSQAPFYVKNDGSLHATAGNIAGWAITSTSLAKGNVGISSNNVNDKGNLDTSKVAFWAGGSRTKAPFRIQFDGKLYSTQGKIANWNIIPNALYSGDKENYQTGTSGLYLGVDGIALGDYSGDSNAFQVNNAGQLTAKKGIIAGWNINSRAIYKGNDDYSGKSLDPFEKDANKKATLKEKNVYFGQAGLALGKNFSIDPEGKLYAVSGLIGGISLSQGGLNASGTDADGTYHNWSIDGAGHANFTAVTINGANVTDMMKASGNGGYSSGGGSLTNNGVKSWGNGLDLKGNGDIGGCKMVNGVLQIKAAHIKDLDVDKLKLLTTNLSINSNTGVITTDSLVISGDLTVDSDASIYFQGWSGGDFLTSLSRRFQDLQDQIDELKRKIPSSGT